MVFPFEFRGRATDLGDPCVFAIADELIYLLTQARGIRVVSRISAAQLDPTLDVRLAGQHFGVQFIVAGVLTHLGDECHIIVHLSRTADGYNIWSNRYSARPQNLINTFEAIVSALTGEIGRVGS
jgi:TolB-like protein